MNINSAFPSKYIKASDLGGVAVPVTITDVKVEQIGKDNDTKPVVYFQGKQKGLVLNKTNARKIADIAGSPDTDEWVGVTISIFPSETEYSGETVECIRVKAPKANGKAKPAEAPAAEITVDEIPF